MGIGKSFLERLQQVIFPPVEYETVCLIILPSALNRMIKYIIDDILSFSLQSRDSRTINPSYVWELIFSWQRWLSPANVGINVLF